MMSHGCKYRQYRCASVDMYDGGVVQHKLLSYALSSKYKSVWNVSDAIFAGTVEKNMIVDVRVFVWSFV